MQDSTDKIFKDGNIINASQRGFMSNKPHFVF